MAGLLRWLPVTPASTADSSEEKSMRANDVTAREALRDIWAEVLRRRPADTDDFFELGGDSLSMVRMLILMEERLSVEVSVEDLFDGDFTFGASVIALEAALPSAAP
jgi:acyl carrier protein